MLDLSTDHYSLGVPLKRSLCQIYVQLQPHRTLHKMAVILHAQNTTAL